MLARWNLSLAWLAVTLTVSAPIFGYAQIHVGANAEIVDFCTAGGPGGAHTLQHGSHSGDGQVPHCPYCPGFCAGVPLAQAPLGPMHHGDIASLPVPPSFDVEPRRRSSVRIAQQRAPPAFS